MELRHLRYFVAVAEELNFTKAAKRLAITQPLLSRQVRDLELEIGAQLLDRNSSRVFLTSAGSRLLTEARVVLQRAAQAVEATRQVEAGVAGTLRLGIAKGLGDIVSRIMSGYLRLFPAVEIDVKDIASGFQSEAFDDRRIDVGFMRPPLDNPQLTSRLLFQQRLSVVLRKASPLAKRARLRLKDLAQENLLMIDRRVSPGFDDKTLELYREAGISPKVIPTATMPYDEAGAILVASGKGIYIAVGENPYYPSFADRLTARLLDEPAAVMPVHIVWRKNEHATLALEFVKHAERMFEKGGEFGYMGQSLAGALVRSPKPAKRGKRNAARRRR
ncbi:MAG TPA: LysR substrate-binding domain-containing protein [Candidatus Baltobacteraceae bacterium]|nr:LysR substrate-binding domain-containing protein [Candidatus Baltobacteraceae bacterium]